MSLPYSSSTPATYPGELGFLIKLRHCDKCFSESAGVSEGRQIPQTTTRARYKAKVTSGFLLDERLTSRLRDILTRASFLNAIVLITVLGGSTNAVCPIICNKAELQ